MCFFSIWALPVRGGGVKACQDGLGHFFPMFACLTEGGGAKLFGQCPQRTDTFQQRASLNWICCFTGSFSYVSILFQVERKCFARGCTFFSRVALLGNFAVDGQAECHLLCSHRKRARFSTQANVVTFGIQVVQGKALTSHLSMRQLRLGGSGC